jgi:hypothetical protein
MQKISKLSFITKTNIDEFSKLKEETDHEKMFKLILELLKDFDNRITCIEELLSQTNLGKSNDNSKVGQTIDRRATNPNVYGLRT